MTRHHATALALLAALALQPALAETHHTDHAGSAGTAAQDAYADGTVRKVDRAGGKLTIKHGPLKSLNMPPMTMVFRVAAPGLLDGVEPGDTVRFIAKDVDGALTVTEIHASR
ncbi:MAG: copper-binding protein [Rhodocyclaceae bacterium]|nr:copper-binding protein [Rhodocyclaceae bacterium]